MVKKIKVKHVHTVLSEDEYIEMKWVQLRSKDKSLSEWVRKAILRRLKGRG